jgi:hypothetical protein
VARSYAFLVCFVLFLGACTEEETTVTDSSHLARVGDVILLQEQLFRDFPIGLSEDDSVNFCIQYIDNWVKEQVVLQTAENELPETKKDVDYQLQKYRNSLIIYEYEKQYIKERLDTSVTQYELEEFYNANKEEFFLRDFIVKAVYAKYTSNTPDLDKVAKSYKYKLPADEMNFRIHVDKYAVKWSYDTTSWQYFNDVLLDIPLQDFNKSSFIKNKKEVMFEEGEFVFFLNILDYKLKDELSPLEFEKERIKSIIVTLRTNELRKELHEQLYNDALNSKKITVYTK